MTATNCVQFFFPGGFRYRPPLNVEVNLTEFLEDVRLVFMYTVKREHLIDSKERLVDTYSKWSVVEVMSSITYAKTIEKLRMIFATHGLPQKLVTDNGATFNSSEFLQFTEKNGI